MLQKKAMNTSNVLRDNFKEMYNLYNNNVPILTITNKYGLPPMSLFRMIVKKNHGITLSKVFKNPMIFNKKDQSQFNLAKANDILEGCDPNLVLENSLRFEDDVEKWLSDQKLSFLTQDDLVKRGSSLTPDFLFSPSVMIRGRSINWIDAKNFYGTKKGFLFKKIKKQVKRYTDAFGEGAIVFSLGCSEEVKISGVTMCFLERVKPNYKILPK